MDSSRPLLYAIPRQVSAGIEAVQVDIQLSGNNKSQVTLHLLREDPQRQNCCRGRRCRPGDVVLQLSL